MQQASDSRRRARKIVPTPTSPQCFVGLTILFGATTVHRWLVQQAAEAQLENTARLLGRAARVLAHILPAAPCGDERQRFDDLQSLVA